MKQLPKISIITPSLNQGQFIERTIISVLNQGYSNIEHIVMDGGSTDGTIEILKRYGTDLIWQSEKDIGQSAAINKGFRKATGHILTWLNSDDTYNDDTINTVVEFFLKNPQADMVYSDGNIIDAYDKIIGVYKSGKVNSKRWIYNGNANIFQPGTFFKKSVIERVGMLDESLHYNMDVDLWIRISRKKLDMQHLRKQIANLRWHKEAKTYNIMDQQKKLHLKILKKYGTMPFIYFLVRHILLVKIKRKILGDNISFRKKNNQDEIGGQEIYFKKIFLEDITKVLK